jgi:XTP/dITP diphosphohydrolase
MKELVFATNNAHKLSEVRRMVGDRFVIRSLADIGCHDDIPETADTLRGNALIKARWVKEKYGYDCFADDTGLMVDALGGAPGVRTARFAGPACDPDDNVTKLLEVMAGEERRTARFCTVIALIKDGREQVMEGTVEGLIATERRGSDGFGYDPVFIPEETGLTFAQMGPDAKNAISHRGRAIAGLLDALA